MRITACVMKMMAISLIFMAAGFVPVHAESNETLEKEKTLVKAWFPDLDLARKAVRSFDALESEYEKGYLVMSVAPEEIVALTDLGFVVEVLENQGKYSAVAPLDASATAIPGYPCYRTVEETFAFALALAQDYPDLAQWVDVGDSWEKSSGLGGYDMMVLKLTSSAISGPKPKLFVTGAIHAREYATAELVNRFAEYLLVNYGTEADATWILDYHEVHLMLMTNPDGRKKAEAGVLWRKNTNQDYCGATSSRRGADLNRNFTFGWGCCNGSSGYPCDETYRGASAASEPEVEAVEAYIRASFDDMRGPNPTDPADPDTPGIYLDIHSHGRLVLWPWGSTSSPAPNHTQLQTLGRKFAYWNGYTPEQSYGLYPTDGTSDGVGYGELGLASYTFELGTAFFQSCSYFQDTILPGNLPSLIYAAKVVRTPYRTPAGPDTYALVLSAGAGQPGVPAGTQVVLSATVSDTRYSSANGTEPSQSVAAAEARLDAPPWEAGAPIAMEAVDGGFNTKTEGVRTTIDTTGLSAGRHSLYVRGRDADGNWGAVSAVFFYISDGSGNLAPQADFTNTIDGRTVAFADTSTDADGSIVSWTWDFGDGENANQQNPSHTYAADGTYRVILTVTDDGGLADTVNQTIVIGQPLVYCDASGNSQRYEWIARVAAGDLDHASDASGYSDFTGMTANLSAGDTAAVSLVPGFAGSTYTEYWKVWIDYNRDGDFDDPGEAVFSGSGRSTVTGSFTVPSATAYGNARMRVAMKYNGAPAACGGFSYGEVEDYTVRIE